MGEICRRYGTTSETITFSQYFLYLKAYGKAHLDEFKERAMAARMSMVTNDGWTDFMNALNSKENAKSREKMIEELKARPIKESSDIGLEYEGITPPKEP